MAVLEIEGPGTQGTVQGELKALDGQALIAAPKESTAHVSSTWPLSWRRNASPLSASPSSSGSSLSSARSSSESGGSWSRLGGTFGSSGTGRHFLRSEPQEARVLPPVVRSSRLRGHDSTANRIRRVRATRLSSCLRRPASRDVAGPPVALLAVFALLGPWLEMRTRGPVPPSSSEAPRFERRLSHRPSQR